MASYVFVIPVFKNHQRYPLKQNGEYISGKLNNVCAPLWKNKTQFLTNIE